MLSSSHAFSLCAACAESIEWIDEAQPAEATIAATWYGGAVRSMILAVKFDQRADLAKPLAQLLVQHPECHAALEAADTIVPVPVHWRRRLTRGYDQAMAIARALPSTLRSRIDNQLLRRTRHTAAQSSRGRSERLANLRDAFSCRPVPKATARGRIILLDDVVSTGATIRACQEALADAGCSHVGSIAVAAALDTAENDTLAYQPPLA